MRRLTTLLSTFFFLFVISTGAWAAPPAKDVNCDLPCINSFEIEDGAVGSADITDGAVDTADIADGAITDAKVTGPISRGNLETASNRVVVAQSGGDFTTIGAALAAITPSAANPYVIDVMPGTYTENITMKSNVHLRGAGREVTTIQTSSGTVITLTNLTDVAISGFTVKGGSWGIYNSNSSPTISDSTITGNSNYGIRNLSNSSPTITGNIISANGEGVENNGGSPFIEGNIFESNNWVGIWNAGSAATIIGNVFTGNGGGYNGDGGIANDNNTTGVISGNTFTGNDPDGISDFTGTSVTITGNTITGSSRYGIYYNGSASAVIINNQITGNATYDVYVITGTPNVSSNVFDTSSGTFGGAYNVKSDGTAW